MKRFRGGLVFEAHRLLYLSTPGLRVIKKKKEKGTSELFRLDVTVLRHWGSKISKVHVYHKARNDGLQNVVQLFKAFSKSVISKCWNQTAEKFYRNSSPWKVQRRPRKVDVELPGKRNSNPHGARPVHLKTCMVRGQSTDSSR